MYIYYDYKNVKVMIFKKEIIDVIEKQIVGKYLFIVLYLVKDFYRYWYQYI